MNSDKTKPTPPASRKSEGARYETCSECGLDWNVSKQAVIHKSGYICPRCWSKQQKR